MKFRAQIFARIDFPYSSRLSFRHTKFRNVWQLTSCEHVIIIQTCRRTQKRVMMLNPLNLIARAASQILLCKVVAFVFDVANIILHRPEINQFPEAFRCVLDMGKSRLRPAAWQAFR